MADTEPFFSIVIFTKNRSQVVGYAIESVLRQTFPEYELIICDNDDPDSDATMSVVKKYDDPRIRYHRTEGSLSMPDNWEHGLSMARGRYVMSLTDRLVLKSYALDTIKKAIERHEADVYVLGYESLYDWLTVNYSSHVCKMRDHRVVSSAYLFDLFLHRPFSEYGDYLPKGFNSCCSNAVLQDIRNSPIGRVCPPVNPDHTLAFLTLAHRSRIVIMNEPLFVSWSPKLSNGVSLARGSSTGKRFLCDLGMTEADLSSEVPIKALGLHNSACNDLLRLKRMLPDLFHGVDLDMFSYFVVCRQEIDFWYAKNDPLYAQQMEAWNEAIAKQPDPLVKKIKSCVESGYPGFKERGSIPRKIMWKVAVRLRRLGRPGALVENTLASILITLLRRPKFVNVLDALTWIEAQEKQSNIAHGAHPMSPGPRIPV